MNMGHDGNMQGQGQGPGPGQQQPGHPGQGQGGGNHNDEHRKQVLKQQQQRLLLLRHASKCPHEAGRCPVTPHCASMKQLWKHIMTCKDQECKVAHCVSSRYVLSHYSKCKDQACPVCGPVREAIRRNYERSKEVVKLASSGNGSGMQMQQQDMGAGGDKPKKKRERKGIDEDGPAGAVKKSRGATAAAASSSALSLVAQGMEAGKAPGGTRGGKGGKGSGQMVASHSQMKVQFPPHQPHFHQLQQQQHHHHHLLPAAPKKIYPYPLDPVSCALYNMNLDNVKRHCKHIHEGMKVTASRVKEICGPILETLMSETHVQNIFGVPVDPIAMNLPDYPDVIKHPMDLGTVKSRLSSGYYRDVQQFSADVHLTFDNAMLYNPSSTGSCDAIYDNTIHVMLSL